MTSDPFVFTYTGRKLDVANPQPGSICIGDIAHALSRIPRWAGCTVVPYSVAQHSLYVVFLARAFGVSLGEQRACLFHDAAEAYLSDIPGPFKALLPDYRKYESSLMQLIASVYRISYPFSADVHHADRLAAAAEARDLFTPSRFGLIPSLQEYKDELIFCPPVIPYASPADAEAAFLKTYHELFT